ncbi:GntR family transcriptional regulator (plasmid) [Neorhizobium galegae]|nr:GntR family transcriptional regulator [Neorhizobium galegae]
MTNETTRDGAKDGATQSAVETAYHRIRHLILTGEMRSGDKLLENQLAAAIGVSRTPIREALNRLNAEGLVVLERYRRGIVADFSLDDAVEIFRLRAILEGHATSRAATRISEAELQRLQELERLMETQFEELGWNEHLEGFDKLNAEFHAVIAAAAESPRLEKDPRLVAGTAGLDLQPLFGAGRGAHPPHPCPAPGNPRGAQGPQSRMGAGGDERPSLFALAVRLRLTGA